MKAQRRRARTAGKASTAKKQTKFIHRASTDRIMNLIGSYRDGPCPNGDGVCRCYYDPNTGNYDANCTQIG
jgi:hypothetical protein